MEVRVSESESTILSSSHVSDCAESRYHNDLIIENENFGIVNDSVKTSSQDSCVFLNLIPKSSIDELKVINSNDKISKEIPVDNGFLNAIKHSHTDSEGNMLKFQTKVEANPDVQKNHVTSNQIEEKNSQNDTNLFPPSEDTGVIRFQERSQKNDFLVSNQKFTTDLKEKLSKYETEVDLNSDVLDDHITKDQIEEENIVEDSDLTSPSSKSVLTSQETHEHNDFIYSNQDSHMDFEENVSKNDTKERINEELQENHIIEKELYSNLQRNEDKEVLSDTEKDTASSPPSSEWIDVIGSGDILMKSLEGSFDKNSEKPVNKDLVVVNFIAKMEGTEECVEVEKEFHFVINDGDTLGFLELGVQLMHVGETAIFKTTPRFAYGKLGRMPNIPPNTNLLYTVTLLSNLGLLDYEKMDFSELFQILEKKLEKARYYYSRLEYENATTSYLRGIEILEKSQMKDLESQSSQYQDLFIKFHNNLSVCQLKTGVIQPCLDTCEKVLMKFPQNKKALYTKSQALSESGNTVGAIVTLEAILKFDKTDKAITDKLKKLHARKRSENEECKKVFKRMFGLTPTNEELAKQDNSANVDITTSNSPSSPSKQEESNKILYFGSAVAVLAFGIASIFVLSKFYSFS